MRTIFFLFLVIGFVACSNNNAPTVSQKDSLVSTPIATDSAAKVEQLSFIDGCVENAKLTLGDAKAFAFCKCMYAQIQVKYPGMDSAQIAKMDTATVAKLAATCR